MGGYLLLRAVVANRHQPLFAGFFALTGAPLLLMRQNEVFRAVKPESAVKERLSLLYTVQLLYIVY